MAGIFLGAALVLVGLAVGSFTNVLVSRFHAGESPFGGRSCCDACRRILPWYVLIPVVSYLIAGGKCRLCRAAIPGIYTIVELATALVFFAVGMAAFRGVLPVPVGNVFPAGSIGATAFTFLYYLLFGAAAVTISVYDFRYQLIPGAFVWPVAGLGIANQVIGAVNRSDPGILVRGGAVALGAFLVFWGLWFFSRGLAMGRGDADVALAIGLYLEPAIAVAGFLFALWVGAAFGILLVAFGKLKWKSRLPFAPFLLGGAMIALLASSTALLRDHLRFFGW